MTAHPTAKARSVDSFRGDTQALSELIRTSWAENDQALMYEPEFLESVLRYPGAGPELAPTMYEGERPLAFGAAFPRRALMNGRELRLGLGAMITVAPELKGLAGGLILRETARRVRQAGLDGMIHYAVEGDPMAPMLIPLCRAMRLPTAKVFTVGYYTRMLFPKPAIDHGGDPDAVEALLTLSDTVDAPFRRVWTREEAEWQCCRRVGAVSLRYSVEDRFGVAAGYIQKLADPPQPAALFIDDLHWGTLTEDERLDMIQALLAKAAARGARLAVVPRLRFFDEAPLLAAKFKPSNRAIHAFLSLWHSELPQEEFKAYYMDVW
ncbi:hypothetical protein [Sphingomonas sp.]|jgi:hypothetical protein|uniref:hypothetical protein n=1 Tax=Sphingomonas sp. TaxID=28214 RepID=UPI002DECE22D|nr:hypothetical protein [Sphingomonas sp.]